MNNIKIASGLAVGVLGVSIIGIGTKRLAPANVVANKPVPAPLLSATMTSEAMFRVICLQEGGGVVCYDGHNNKPGEVGPANITWAYLHDANQWLKDNNLKTYALAEMANYHKAYIVCRAYWALYGFVTLEERCRCHAGGPDGPYQDCTLCYWQGCQRFL